MKRMIKTLALTALCAGTALAMGCSKNNASKTPEEIMAEPLNEDQVKFVIESNWYQIEDCYSVALRKDPNLTGYVTIKWVVNKTGNVEAATVDQSTVNNAFLESCTLDVVKRWKFGGVEDARIAQLKYQFVFDGSTYKTVAN